MATGSDKLSIKTQAKGEVTAYVRRMSVEALKVAIGACPDLDTLAVVLQEASERKNAEKVFTEEMLNKLPHWGKKPERYPEAFSWDAKRVLVFNENSLGGWELRERFDVDDADDADDEGGIPVRISFPPGTSEDELRRVEERLKRMGEE